METRIGNKVKDIVQFDRKQDTAMAKRTKPSPILPREIMFQIAQFLPEEASFVGFIKALKGTTYGQEPIDAVWRLRQGTRHPYWPNLELYLMEHQEFELAIQTIPLYSQVILNAECELHRLVDRVTPSTNLIVIHHGKPDLARIRQRFDQLAQLPVRGLVYTTMCFADRMPLVIPHLVNVWSSLTYLRRLNLTVGDEATLESICKCIATSQITKLRLEGHKSVNGNTPDGATPIKLEGVVWTYLVAWLHSTTVVRFELYMFSIICDDDATMQALNGALAAADGLEKIDWAECGIRISAPLVLPTQLRELSLPWCTFELVGIECTLKLLLAMPHLTEVDVARIPLSPSDVDTLASVLAQSNVSYLNLGDCSIGSVGPYADCFQRLADAVEASASLRNLRLAYNDLGITGVKTILAAVERRPFVTELVDLSGTCPGYRWCGELIDLIKTRAPQNTIIFL